jgi:hypothetical protein
MRLAREFLVLSMGTVFVLLVLSHGDPAEGIIEKLGGALIGVYGTLQGRNVQGGGTTVWGNA